MMPRLQLQPYTKAYVESLSAEYGAIQQSSTVKAGYNASTESMFCTDTLKFIAVDAASISSITLLQRFVTSAMQGGLADTDVDLASPPLS